MAVIAWVVSGALIAVLARMLDRKSATRLPSDLSVGIVGGVVGGALFHMVTRDNINVLNFASAAVASACAGLSLLAFHAVLHSRLATKT